MVSLSKEIGLVGGDAVDEVDEFVACIAAFVEIVIIVRETG